ncbi:mCG1050998 [Mus musculus]|nr:mCG1050998 [Mus musculus]
MNIIQYLEAERGRKIKSSRGVPPEEQSFEYSVDLM